MEGGSCEGARGPEITAVGRRESGDARKGHRTRRGDDDGIEDDEGGEEAWVDEGEVEEDGRAKGMPNTDDGLWHLVAKDIG